MRGRNPTRWLSVGAGALLTVGLLAGDSTAAPGGLIDRLLASGSSSAKTRMSVVAKPAEAEPAVDAARWRLAGDRALSAGDATEAEAIWTRGLAVRPDDPGLLDRVARVRGIGGDWQGALAAERSLVTQLGTAAAKSPDAKRLDLTTGRDERLADNHRRHLGMLSELAVLAGDFTTAEEAADALVRLAPGAVDGHLALGYLHLHARELDAAADAYRDALALDPTNPVALNNLGAVRYLQQDLDGAAKSYEAVLSSLARSAASESVALANLAELSQLAARYDDAEYLYREAVEALPAGAWSYMGLAALLDVTGRYDEAVDAMIDGWERDGNRATRLNMHYFAPEWGWQRDALIAEIEGDVEGAIVLWRKVAYGDVAALRRPAEHHLASLELMRD